jgi:hypothetical protein
LRNFPVLLGAGTIEASANSPPPEANVSLLRKNLAARTVAVR